MSYGSDNRPAASVPGPLFDLEAEQGRGEAKGVSGLTELRQMLGGPKCFVMSTTESVPCKSLSNQRGRGEISISLLSVCKQISVFCSQNTQSRFKQWLVG